MFVISAITKAQNKETMFYASFLSHNLFCEFNFPRPDLLRVGLMGIIELLHIPCGQEVLAPTNQRELFLILSSSTHTFSTVPGQERQERTH